MKNSLNIKLLLAAILLVCSNIVLAQTTTVWIVRHAEKDISNPADANPGLTAIGEQRAKDLAVFLKDNSPAVIYSTAYKRTQATALGFSNDDLQKYDPKVIKTLAEQVLQNYKGKSVLIIGHSNTVLETIEAFGGKRPISVLSDDDYDYIFKVSIKKGKVKTQVFQYGAKHRGAMGGEMKK